MRFMIVILSVLFAVAANAQEKRNLFTDSFSRKFVGSVITMDHNWIGYPTYHDRKSWSRIPEDVKNKTIESAEHYLEYPWPNITASMYLEFTRSGDRSLVDSRNGQRRRVLQALALAELMEGKGRFMDDLINGVFAICEQTYWGASAHFYLYGFDTQAGTINDPHKVVPDIEDPIIDLFAAEMAADLAWIWYFFHEEFDKISPLISKRLKLELKNKILEPYYNRHDMWWMTGWGEGDRMFDEWSWTMNNWTTWISYNMLQVILLIEEDGEKKQNGVYKSMISINEFLNFYPDDGACMEGPGYWGHAGAKLFAYLQLLKRNTNGEIDLFDNELVKNIGRFIYRAYISNGVHYINFASAGPVIRHDPGLVFRFGQSIEDPVLQEFGVFLMQEFDFGDKAVGGPVNSVLENLFNLTGWEETPASEPLLREFYFEDSEIVLARDKEGSTDGFYFTAWGGDNGGGHNHNDIGSCILYFNGTPVLIDVGRRGTQTAMHNLPLINGFAQPSGGKYKAKNSNFTSNRSRVVFSTDISAAYPPEASVERWVRSYRLDRNRQFTIRDGFRLTQNPKETKFHFMTGLPTRMVGSDKLEFSGTEFTLQMKFDPDMLSVHIEEGIFNDEIVRIVFDLQDKSLSGEVVFEISEVKK